MRTPNKSQTQPPIKEVVSTMSLFPQIIKDKKFTHCSNNATKLSFLLFCPKFIAESKNRVKKWDNCRSLYYHLIAEHQFDKTLSPSLPDSISWLQSVSDAINQRWIK